MEEQKTGIEKVTQTIGDVISGVPEPIRKNFFKAFGQLCTATVDIPVAWLEGRASEIRAESEARVQIIKKGGANITNKLQIHEAYIEKAGNKYASKIVKEQLNLDEIGINAANNLASEKNPETQEAIPEISDDWLNEFENYAKLKSSEDMKIIFGKILSGEVSKPGSFSIRTVRLISQLDNKAARIFQKLCSNVISMKIGGTELYDARVVSINGNAGSNKLSQYGLSFGNLNILNEYGLIISNYNSQMPYSPCIANENNTVGASVVYQNKHFAFVPTDREKFDKELKLSGVALTLAGIELMNIIPIVETGSYKSDFEEFLSKKFLILEEIEGYI